MAGAEIRVVQCPKCEKFLPELPNYSVYICGGCGARLQAKKSPATLSDGDNSRYLELVESTSDKGSAAAAELSSVASREAATRRELGANDVMPPVAASPPHDNLQAAPIIDDGVTVKPGASTYNAAATRNDGKYRRSRRVAATTNGGVRRRDEDSANGEPMPTAEVRGRMPPSPARGPRPGTYPDEGSSDYYGQRYGSNEPASARAGEGSAPAATVDRSEILRMLDELRDKVQQSYEVSAKPSSGITSESPRYRSVRDRAGGRTPQDRPRNSPVMAEQNISGSFSVPSQHDAYGSRAPSYAAGQNPWRNFDSYFFGLPDPLVSHHHEGFYHQPSCSCMHCYHGEFLPVHNTPPPPPPLPLAASNHRRAPYTDEGQDIYASQSYYSSRTADSTVPQSHQRITQVKPPPRQTCVQVFGAAPLTICDNCFEVLQLPRRVTILESTAVELRCGSCSKILLVKLDGSKLDAAALIPVVALPSPDPNTTRKRGQSLVEALRSDLQVDLAQEAEPPLNSGESEKLSLNVVNSMTRSRLEENTESAAEVSSPRNISHSAKHSHDGEASSSARSLPVRDHSGVLSEKGSEGSDRESKSTRSEEEKAVLLTEALKQSSIKDVAVANELNWTVYRGSDDLSFSQRSSDVDLEEDELEQTEQPRMVKGQFFSNLVKKGFKISNSMNSSKAKVFVNGYPIHDRAVKKAEKLAGTIYAGEYWYDYHAGFWGNMGQPCLGIIPPFIKEFNYPMPKDCAGGNTGVLVNGRELHRHDLNLLTGRGLPDTPGRSYRVEISGKVLDFDTGKALFELGKLAPTIEKMKRGFGMRPRPS